MREIRCPKCNALQFKVQDNTKFNTGGIHILCRNCGSDLIVSSKVIVDFMTKEESHKGRRVFEPDDFK